MLLYFFVCLRGTNSLFYKAVGIMLNLDRVNSNISTLLFQNKFNKGNVLFLFYDSIYYRSTSINKRKINDSFLDRKDQEIFLGLQSPVISLNLESINSNYIFHQWDRYQENIFVYNLEAKQYINT